MGTSDVLTDGREGYLLNSIEDEKLASLILELAGDPKRRQTLGERARKRAVEAFPVQTMVRKYEDIYIKLARNCENKFAGSAYV